MFWHSRAAYPTPKNTFASIKLHFIWKKTLFLMKNKNQIEYFINSLLATASLSNIKFDAFTSVMNSVTRSTINLIAM